MSPRVALAAGLLALLAGCAGGGITGSAFRPDVYEVRPGDTLYSIAWRYGLDHRKLQRWNDLESADHIRVGQRLRLRPDEGARAAARGSGKAAGTPAPAAGSRAAREDRRDDGGGAGAPAGGGPDGWRWPADGQLIGTFTDGRVPGRGIDLGGDPGSPIVATAGGEVVYSGEGLQAYGQLVIIQHQGDFLSAYAHNERLLVDEGQQVVAGQQIAGMGTTNNGRTLLHFEIRRQGTPVDPLDYLPARE